MSPSGHASPRVLSRLDAMPAKSSFELHRHDRHQLAWAASGVLTVDCDTGAWVLPPSRALWIPAGTRHRTGCSLPAVMRSLYLDPASCPAPAAPTPRPAPPVPHAVEVTPLLAALIGHLGEAALPAQQRRRALAVMFDAMVPSHSGAVHAPLPADPRARAVAEGLRAAPDDGRDLAAWAAGVSTSARTLARLFRHETGLSFGRWRTAARVQAALVLLAEGHPVASVGPRVGYETPSAFVAAFRRHTGTTPGAYFRVPTGQAGAG